MRSGHAALGLSCTLLTAACGTVLHGARQDVRIEASPAHATLHLLSADEGSSAATGVPGEEIRPGVHSLARDRAHIIRATAPGYEPTWVLLTPEVIPWLAYVSVPTMGTSAFVDIATGAIFELAPHDVRVVLRPAAGEGPEDGFAMAQAAVLKRRVSIGRTDEDGLVRLLGPTAAAETGLRGRRLLRYRASSGEQEVRFEFDGAAHLARVEIVDRGDAQDWTDWLEP